MAVFKYRALGAEGTRQRHFAKRLVQEGECYFAPPTTFNDTFEALPALAWSESEASSAWSELLSRLGEQQTVELFGFAEATFSIDVIGYLRSTSIVQALQTLFAAYCDKHFGLLCTSRTNTNMQQWSYYGEDHRGFCVELDVPETLQSSAISYSEQRPVVNALGLLGSAGFNRDEALRILMVKSAGWSHEEEVRIVKEGPGALCLGDRIRSIHLGCRASRESETLIRDWLANSPWPSTPVVRMAMSRDDFSLHPYSDSTPELRVLGQVRLNSDLQFVDEFTSRQLGLVPEGAGLAEGWLPLSLGRNPSDQKGE